MFCGCARHGDERAFALIVRQYQTPLFNYVARVLGGDRALAEDLCQEVFLRVYQALPGFDSALPVHDLAVPGGQAPGGRRAARTRAPRPARRSTRRPCRTLSLAMVPAESVEEMDVVWRAIGSLTST